jgi:hypothetical protein
VIAPSRDIAAQCPAGQWIAAISAINDPLDQLPTPPL